MHLLNRTLFHPNGREHKLLLFQKLGKVAELAESYKAISFLHALSNLLEKFLFLGLFTIAERHKLIPNYQCDFRYNYAHRIDIQIRQKNQ